MNDNNKLETKRIFIFLGISFFLTYVMEITVIRPLLYSEDSLLTTLGQALISVVMMIPAFSVLITRLITKEGFKNSWLKPVHFKKTFLYYLLGWFGPVILTALGALLYFLIFPEKLDTDFGYLKQVYQATTPSISVNMLTSILVVQIITAVFLSPVLNAIFCFGEEWGWRGYLLPKMKEKLPMLPMLLVTGIIWGLWHAPLTVMGHNYGFGYSGYPFTGILSMILFCIVMGTIFTFLTLKAKSCIPAVIAHGSLNGFASIGIFFTEDGGNPFVGPAPTGIIGGSIFMITAIVMALILIKREREI